MDRSTPEILRSMGPRARYQLEQDIKTHGARVLEQGISRRAMESALGLRSKRARRLAAWATAVRAGQTAPTGARGRRHLVIGDAHAKPGQSLERFAWLGRMIRDLRPDVVVAIGDWYGMDSLCTHSSRAELEGQRLALDLAAGDDALDILHGAMGETAAQLHFTVGNHEHRVRRMVDDNPALEGVLHPFRKLEDRGWTVHPFLAPLRVDGVRYQHYLPNGSGRATSGKYLGLRLLEGVHYEESIVVGHSHILQYRPILTQRGRSVHSLSCGWFGGELEAYAGESARHWWAGIAVLDGVTDGDFDLQLWSMRRIRETWGEK